MLSLILSQASHLKRSRSSLVSKILDLIGPNTHTTVKTLPCQAAVMQTQVKVHHRGQHLQRVYLKFISQVAHDPTRAQNFKDSPQLDRYQVRAQAGHPGQLSAQINISQLE
jgi:hypothetical protein